MGSPSRTRLQSCRHFSCWGPSLPWLLQPQSLSPLLLLNPTLMLIPGTATDTVDMDGAATTDLMATMATTERGQQAPSQRPLLPLTLTRTLMLGTATMATDTVDMDTVATTGPMATTATTERGLPSLSPLLLLSPRLMLIPWYGYGYRGYGYGGYYRPHGYYGYYGKRSADAEPAAEPAADAVADPTADADAWYGHYGYGGYGYGGYGYRGYGGYYRPYGYGGYWGGYWG